MAAKKPASRTKKSRRTNVKRPSARPARASSKSASDISDNPSSFVLALTVIFTLLSLIFAMMAFWRFS